MPRENNRRTYDPPRFRDDHSFFGRGRVRHQKFNANAQGQPEPPSPPVDGAPIEPKG